MTLAELFGTHQHSGLPRHVFRMGDDFVGETFDAPVEDIYQLFKERLVHEVFARIAIDCNALAPLVDMEEMVPGVELQGDIAKVIAAAKHVIELVRRDGEHFELHSSDATALLIRLQKLHDALKGF